MPALMRLMHVVLLKVMGWRSTLGVLCDVWVWQLLWLLQGTPAMDEWHHLLHA